MLALGTNHGVVLWDLADGRKFAFLQIGLAWHSMFEKSGELLTSGSIGVWRWPLHLDFRRSEFRIGPPRQLPFPGSDADVAEDQSGRTVALASFVRADVQTSGRMAQVGPLDDCRSVASALTDNGLRPAAIAGCSGLARPRPAGKPTSRQSMIVPRSSSAPTVDG